MLDSGEDVLKYCDSYCVHEAHCNLGSSLKEANKPFSVLLSSTLYF